MNDEERSMLEVVRDEFAAHETRLSDQVAAIFRWMMATLFAANFGAVIAVMDKELDQALTSALVWF